MWDKLKELDIGVQGNVCDEKKPTEGKTYLPKHPVYVPSHIKGLEALLFEPNTAVCR